MELPDGAQILGMPVPLTAILSDKLVEPPLTDIVFGDLSSTMPVPVR